MKFRALLLLLLLVCAHLARAQFQLPALEITGVQLAGTTYAGTNIALPAADLVPTVLLRQDINLPTSKVLVTAYIADPATTAPVTAMYLAQPGSLPAGVVTALTLDRPLPFSTASRTQPLRLVINAYAYYASNTYGQLQERVYILDPPAPLPVTLVRFVASVAGATTHLTWLTANEVNVARFEVQTSGNGFDFGPVASVASGRSSYAYDLVGVPAYVRLRCVDRDGSSAYSPVMALGASTEYFLVVGRHGYAFPLEPGDAPLGCTWRDLAGRAVAGEPTPGVYVVQLATQAGRVISKRVVVE